MLQNIKTLSYPLSIAMQHGAGKIDLLFALFHHEAQKAIGKETEHCRTYFKSEHRIRHGMTLQDSYQHKKGGLGKGAQRQRVFGLPVRCCVPSMSHSFA